jgi:hypothetical protein
LTPLFGSDDIHTRNAIMIVYRIILAVLIAMSVATLPIAGGVAAIAKTADASMSAPMDDCDHRVMPCHKGMADCQSMAACALKCFNFSGTSFSILSFPLVLTDRATAFADGPFHPQTSSPPFRPPRV